MVPGFAALFLLGGCLDQGPTDAEDGADISGPARIVDGDTLEVADTKIRLDGIDAPESRQTCHRPDGREWACGRWATRRLSRLAAGRVSCTPLDTDHYGRTVARCESGGRDLGAAMVRGGAAFAYRRYSRDYVSEERAARRGLRGIWLGEAERPGSYRHSTKSPAAPQPEGCAIKGNISANGRIFHRPGDAFYGRTRIDTGDGERWFCSAAAARAAGWRAARR